MRQEKTVEEGFVRVKKRKCVFPVIVTSLVFLVLIYGMIFWNTIDRRNNKRTILESADKVVSYFRDFGLTNNLPVKIEDAKCRFMILPGHRLYQAVSFQASQDALDLYVQTLKEEKAFFTRLSPTTNNEKTDLDNIHVLEVTGWDTPALTNINAREVFYINSSGSDFYIYSCGGGPVVDVFFLVKCD